ncbi:MAG TPA: ATP-binding protein, partial [Chryseosolibacter sp.]|nr:ATP-binding protein [Chryseosolibacter sp.]
ETRIIATTCDITAIKSIETENQRHLDELNRSNRELEEFAYVASHDLQEPLRKIALYSDRLLAKYLRSPDQEGELFANRIQASAQNMKMLIDNLLEFSRAHGSVEEFVPVDLRQILDRVISNLELKIEETKTEISIGPLPRIEAVPIEMEQLFTNLISNSIKFRQQSVKPRVQIGARFANAEEKRSCGLNDDQVCYVIEVKDNGIGFEQENAKKIFQIFERLHGKTEYPGTGIGLAICKRIVDNHQGIISAEGVPGMGASFKVIIPEKQF